MQVMRWENERRRSDHVSVLYIGGVKFGDVRPDPDAWYPEWSVSACEFEACALFECRRRSDAKRWLLARAAGLAEVPRRSRWRVYNGPQWRLVSIEPKHHDGPYWAPFGTYERNRSSR